MKPEPCRCHRYKFPHRRDSGLCNATEREEEREAKAWLHGMSRLEAMGWAKARDADVD